MTSGIKLLDIKQVPKLKTLAIDPEGLSGQPLGPLDKETQEPPWLTSKGSISFPPVKTLMFVSIPPPEPSV